MMKASLTTPKRLTAIFTLVLSSTLILSGCQATKELLGKRDNGSLEYQDSKKLAPLEMPVAQESAPFVPLYPTPSLGANTLKLQNESGKQYQLPKPERVVPVTTTPAN